MQKYKTALLMTTCLAVAPMNGAIAADMDELKFEEIIVTANKREQRSIDVPMTLDVLGAEEMQRRGIDSVQDLSFAVPGVTLRYDGPGSLQIFMRGVGNLAGSDALVSMYMDESPVTLSGGYRQLDLRSLDIERVEVLKGPQATLYGQGAVAGTIRFITKEPNLDEAEGLVEAEMSFIDQGDTKEKLTGVINTPLIPGELALRVAGTLEQGGGWIDQPEANIKDGNNQDVYNFRAKLRWKPSETFDMTATAASYRNKSQFGLDYEEEDRTNEVGGGDRGRVLPPRNERYTLLNLTGNLDLGTVSLISATTYINLKRDYHLTYIAGSGTVYGVQNEGYDIINDRNKQLTEELRLSSNEDSAFQYTVGLFYRDVSGDLPYDGLNVYDGTEYPYSGVDRLDSQSWSVFADTSYAITDRLEIGAGIRQFRDSASYTNDFTAQEDVFKSTDPRFHLSYAVNDDVNVYASVAKGFRSGGFNSHGLPPFGPEKVWNYELGAKGSLADGAFTFEIAAYYSDYKDMLRRGLLFDPANDGSGFVNLTSNIGEVQIKGAEGTFAWRTQTGLIFSASAAYNDSEITSLELGAGESSAVQEGDRGDYVPEFTFTAAIDYEFDWSDTVEGFFHADYNYRDKVYYTDDFLYLPEFRVQSSDSVGLFSARVGANWDKYIFEVFATNLTNENKVVDPFAIWSQANRTKPRTIGVKLGMHF